jgi:hypothetical protein
MSLLNNLQKTEALWLLQIMANDVDVALLGCDAM